MQSLSHVTFAGFQPTVLGVKHQATGVQQPSAVGQLAQTQTTDVLGAMPHYRPLPIGVRSGNGEEKLTEASQKLEKVVKIVSNELDPTLKKDIRNPEVANSAVSTLEELTELVGDVSQILGSFIKKS
ncbi:MAG: hypothetical protein H2174_01980 [Vampirovibrio sp.]|nr:hypothetical protein [Vampirovibrio sp.]